MTKNILKNFLLTDLYENEEGIIVNNEITVDNKKNEFFENDNCSDLKNLIVKIIKIMM